MTSSSCSKKAFFLTTDITSIGTLMLSKGPWAWWMIYIKLQTYPRSLRKRTSLLFAISDKHSGSLLNFPCCFLYLELGLSWVIHVWTSDFKLFQENENLKLSLGWAFDHSFKAPPWGDCGFCIVLIPHSSQPLPSQFSCLSQKNLWEEN